MCPGIIIVILPRGSNRSWGRTEEDRTLKYTH
jgi:hypothetical protein